jgi:hypothetical protein
VSQAGSNVDTDLSVTQIVDLGCLTKNMKSDQIAFDEILGSDFYTEITRDELIANTDAIVDFLAEKFK